MKNFTNNFNSPGNGEIFDMEISIGATNGERCVHETHLFRIGVDSKSVTEFQSNLSTFHDNLVNALIEHKKHSRKCNGYLYLQVKSGFQFVNVQNQKTGGVMAITNEIAGQHETAITLFKWACNSVQMGGDIEILADGLAKDA